MRLKRLFVRMITGATEVVLSGKLGGNEVFP
jgi:hypothetical protein